MEFSTKVAISPSAVPISHRDRIMAFGSCFSENIGTLLIENKFDINSNPFGILYNPKSISQALERIIEGQTFSNEEIFEYNGLYQSFWHHGSFSSPDKNTCLEKINHSLQTTIQDIRKANILIITFGTAYVFQFKESGMIVGNCHKMPASCFERYRLDVHTIVNDWNTLTNKLKEINPLLHIIFTVSPIRHLKDGAHDNQLSKSTLLLAIDELIKANKNTSYFPSYEIVLDELRDYRFYNEDMIHPTSVAIKYIWNRFSETYFDDKTIRIMAEWAKINNALNHRPINGNSEEYKLFLRQTLLKLKSFKEKYPYICCENEIYNLEITLQ